MVASGAEARSVRRGKVLVAGVGNELRRDDGLGPAVIRALAERGVPEHVDLVDFGTRLYDLLLRMRGYGALVVVDAVDLGGEPGEVYVLEPGVGSAPEELAPHSAGLREVLALAKELGLLPPKVYVVGCQPADRSYGTGLSEEVRRRLGDLVEIVLRLLEKL